MRSSHGARCGTNAGLRSANRPHELSLFLRLVGRLTMAVLNYLVFLPEEKGGLEYVEGWQNYGLTASIIIFYPFIFRPLAHTDTFLICGSRHPRAVLTLRKRQRIGRDAIESLVLCAVHFGAIYGGCLRCCDIAQRLFRSPFLGTHQYPNRLSQPAVLPFCAARPKARARLSPNDSERKWAV